MADHSDKPTGDGAAPGVPAKQPDVQPDVRPDAQPDAQPDVRPDVRPEPVDDRPVASLAPAVESDPEATRVAELLTRTQSGTASEAEREELAMYLEDRPDLAARIARRVAAEREQAARQAELGGTWLARVDADRRLAEAESTPWVKAERGVGLGLTIAGFALTPFSPVLSMVGLIGGVGLLTWSFTRIRLATYKDDPYRDVDK